MSRSNNELPDPRRASTEELLSHATWLRRLARSLVADAATADDLVQDAWIAAMRRPPRMDQPLAPWLARVVRNLAHGRHRGETRRATREAERFVERHEPGADERAGSLEMQRLLLDTVESLGEPSKSTVVRHYFHGKTSVEIAREDGVAQGTVRWRLKQAVDELKTRLDARHRGDRRAWSVLLAPLARQGDTAASTTTLAASAAVGVFLMGAWIKIALAVVVVALCVGGWVVSRPGDPVSPPIVAAEAPLAPSVLGAPPVMEPAPAAPLRSVLPVSTPEPTPGVAATAVAAAPSEYTATIEARILDERGMPIEGATMTCIRSIRPDRAEREVAPKAASGDNGRVRLAVTKADTQRGRGRSALAAPDTWLMVLEVTAAAKAAQRNEIDVKADGTFSLGDIVLVDGGDLAGRVVDAEGRPLEGAEVRLILSDLTVEEREVVAKQGLTKRSARSRVTTDSEGRYAVESVRTGPYRVWSKLGGRFNVVSEPFDVTTGRLVTVPDLVMVDDPRSIRGVVLGMDGGPAKAAEVEYTMTDSGRDYWVGVSADKSGVFVIEEFDADAVDVYAVGPWAKGDGMGGEHRDRGQALARNVKAGTRDLVLRLAPTPLTVVVVKDTDGAVVDPIGVSVFDLRGNGGGGTMQGPEHRVRLLAKPCQIVVKGAGYVPKTVGPFEPGNAPARIEVVVERTAMVSGRVTCDGQACARAYVSAHRLLPADTQMTQNGFRLRLDPNGRVPSGQTDANGRFAFNVEENGRWVLVARSKGFATWESEPMDLGPDQGKEDLEIALGHGGALAGRVTSMSGADSEPGYVSLARGGGSHASVRIESDGTFRLENLTPGKWLIRMTREDGSEGGVVLDRMPGDPAAREVEIVEGRTAEVELDALAFASPRVSGRITIQGGDTTKWTAGLFTTDTKRDRGPTCAIDASGGFELVADVVGPHRLKLTRSVSAERSVTIEQDLDLAHGTTHWTLDVATGALRLPATAAGDIVLSWTAGNGARWSTQVRKAGGTELVVDHVPAGTVRIETPDHAATEALVTVGIVSSVSWR